jgi:ferric-dicitrate binding protein FerR (iron transport regulator)
VWSLLKSARKAYKSWKSLDPEHREALSDEAERVLRLTVELGGGAAARFVEGRSDDLEEITPTDDARRPREEITAELQAAVLALSVACVAPGTQILNDSTPHSMRLGGKMLAIGAKRLPGRLRNPLGLGDNNDDKT